MASDIDIANMSLSHLGDSATVASFDPPEGSAQAGHCAMFYPMARDALLEMRAWKFATRREYLVRRDVATWNWTYAYTLPPGALRILSILPSNAASDAESEKYELEGDDQGGLIYTNVENATIRYTKKVDDAGKFTPLFTEALARLLAANLAGPLLKGEAGRAEAKAQYQLFLAALGQASTVDANNSNNDAVQSVAWIDGR